MNPGIGFLGTIVFMLGSVGLLFVGEPDPSATHTDERPPNPPAYTIKRFAPNPERDPLGLRQPLTGPRAEEVPADHIGNVNNMVFDIPSHAVVVTQPLDETAMRAIVGAAGFADPDAAIRVARCESSFNPGAVGGAGELGLWQIHPIHFEYIRATFGSDVDITDPSVNAWYAARLSAGGTDWSHWSCQP